MWALKAYFFDWQHQGRKEVLVLYEMWGGSRCLAFRRRTIRRKRILWSPVHGTWDWQFAEGGQCLLGLNMWGCDGSVVHYRLELYSQDDRFHQFSDGPRRVRLTQSFGIYVPLALADMVSPPHPPRPVPAQPPHGHLLPLPPPLPVPVPLLAAAGAGGQGFQGPGGLVALLEDEAMALDAAAPRRLGLGGARGWLLVDGRDVGEDLTVTLNSESASDCDSYVRVECQPDADVSDSASSASSRAGSRYRWNYNKFPGGWEIVE